MIKRILVGLGGTKFTSAAIRQAVELAAAHDAEVTGVGVVDVGRLSRVGPVPLGAMAYAAELRNARLQVACEHVEQSLRKFEHVCNECGIRHRVLNEEEEPFSLMIDQARYHDLMIFGLRSLFEFDLVSDPQDALARLVASGVRPILAVGEEHRPIERVLIAYSGSMESAKTIDFCRAHGFEPEEAYVPHSPKDHLLPRRRLECRPDRRRKQRKESAPAKAVRRNRVTRHPSRRSAAVSGAVVETNNAVGSTSQPTEIQQ